MLTGRQQFNETETNLRIATLSHAPDLNVRLCTLSALTNFTLFIQFNRTL